MTDIYAHDIRARVIHVADRNIGYGELEENNDGPLIRAMGGRPGGEWCALFAGYCYRRACEMLGVGPPVWAWRRPGVLETGARALVRAAWASGLRRFEDPFQALPGDLILWRRGIGWQGHVGLVERVDGGGLAHTIEGNVGRFPARVRRLVHDIAKEDRFAGFAGLR